MSLGIRIVGVFMAGTVAAIGKRLAATAALVTGLNRSGSYSICHNCSRCGIVLKAHGHICWEGCRDLRAHVVVTLEAFKVGGRWRSVMLNTNDLRIRGAVEVKELAHDVIAVLPLTGPGTIVCIIVDRKR
jgi:hypothetical protein